MEEIPTMDLKSEQMTFMSILILRTWVESSTILFFSSNLNSDIHVKKKQMLRILNPKRERSLPHPKLSKDFVNAA